MLRATIGMRNYTGTACTFNFVKSVCVLPEHMDRSHFKVRQLLALFPGTVIEDVGEGAAVESQKLSPSIGANDAKVQADLVAAVAKDEAAKAPDEVKQEPEEAEVEEEAEEVEEPEEPEKLKEEPEVVETSDERIARLVEEYSRDQLIDWAEEIGATHATKATKLDIAREIVEKENTV